MKIAILVAAIIIVAAIVFGMLRQSARRKRLIMLLGRWHAELPNLAYQLRFVPWKVGAAAVLSMHDLASFCRMRTAENAGELCTQDLAIIAVNSLSEGGVDPSVLTAQEKKERFKEQVDYVKVMEIGSESMEWRKNYERLVARALEILHDTENRYSQTQQMAAELVLLAPLPEMAKVKAAEADAYFQKMCSKVAAGLVSQAKAGTGDAAAAGAGPAGPAGPDAELREAITERVVARHAAANSGIDPAGVHREMPANRAGKIAEVIAHVDAQVEEHMYFDKLDADKPEGLRTLRRKMHPIAWAAIGKQDLSLPEALRVSSVLGLDLTELGIAELEEKCAAAKAAAPDAVADAWTEFKKFGETVSARFESLRALWKIIGLRYESFLAKEFRNWQVHPQPEAGELFSMVFEYQSCNHWHPVAVRQVEPGALLIWDSGRELPMLPGIPSVQLVLAKDAKPLVTWPVRGKEKVDLAAAHAATRMKGLEKELHVSLDGSLTIEGLPGGERWAIVTRDRISGELKNVEASGHAKAAAGNA